jgi:hypothetical protein
LASRVKRRKEALPKSAAAGRLTNSEDLPPRKTRARVLWSAIQEKGQLKHDRKSQQAS